jgi:hypothetical protein
MLVQCGHEESRGGFEKVVGAREFGVLFLLFLQLLKLGGRLRRHSRAAMVDVLNLPTNNSGQAAVARA